MTSVDLKGQTALITGASRGIGAAILQALGANGARVVGTGTATGSVEVIDAAITRSGFDGFGHVLDVTRADSIEALVREIDGRGITPTILINNAGITRDNLLMRMKDEEWDAVIGANLNSLYRLCKAFIRGMLKARHGRIVNITSVVGQTGNPGQTNYCAAKAGIIGFTKSLAREVATRGITVNAIAPGFIDTDMTRALNDEQRQGILGQIPMNRLGSADEVAAAVVFLASPGASYITGETLSVNGGMFMP
jgi:3-oxoacyl-[acyl-carrier protein] reductase